MDYLNDDRISDILSNVVINLKLKSWRYTCKDSMKAIENYFGVLIPVNVMGSIDSDRDPQDYVTLHLLFKIPPKDINERIMTIFKYMFEAESYFYTVLLPIYRNIDEISIDELVPECYYASSKPQNQVLVLQNMAHEGYIRYNRSFLDKDHTKLALEALAKLHGLSVLALEKGKVRLNDNSVMNPYTDTNPVELNISLKTALKNHNKYFVGTKYDSYIKGLITRYNMIRLNSSEKIRRFIHGHGDYWKENILFKYEGERPIKACIVDFQTMRSLSPAQDFLSFITVSTDGKRLKYYKEFVSIYLESIKCILLEHNENLADLYEDDFMHDLNVVAEDCLITSFMAFALWFGLEEDALVKSKNTADIDTARLKFVDTISRIIDDYELLGLISL